MFYEEFSCCIAKIKLQLGPPCSGSRDHHHRHNKVTIHLFSYSSSPPLVLKPHWAMIGRRVNIMEHTIRVRVQAFSHPRNISGPLVGCVPEGISIKNLPPFLPFPLSTYLYSTSPYA